VAWHWRAPSREDVSGVAGKSSISGPVWSIKVGLVPPSEDLTLVGFSLVMDNIGCSIVMNININCRSTTSKQKFVIGALTKN
jgi:hypothetical protein